MDKVINPLTGHWITKNKDTYNKLIKKGYGLVNECLVLQSVITLVQKLPSEIIIEEILQHMMNPGHVLATCKAFQKIYHMETFWKKMYQIYFPQVKIIVNNTALKAYKICYNLFFLTCSTTYLDMYYTRTNITWYGIVNNERFIYSMSYIPNLKSILFKIKIKNAHIWTNYDISYYHKILPNVKSITIEYIE